jgi:hypothetical protein
MTLSKPHVIWEGTLLGLLNSALESMWTEAVDALFEVKSQQLSGRTKETYEEVRIAGLLSEI